MGDRLLYHEFKEKQLKEHIRAKLHGHNYDREHDFQYDESDFVDEEWVLQQLERARYICRVQGCEMVTERGSNRQRSIERIDNKKGHTKKNCRIICVSCNVTRQNTI